MKHPITQVTQTPYSPDLAPCNFWLFPKRKSPLKGKKFQNINEIQENTTGHLIVIGRIVWGPKVPTLKGTKASLSYVECSLYLVKSSKNVSICHVTWLDTFWTDLIYEVRLLFYLVCGSSWKSNMKKNTLLYFSIPHETDELIRRNVFELSVSLAHACLGSLLFFH